jgi:hypothetical protein
MNHILRIDSTHRLDNSALLFEKEIEIHVDSHPPTLDEIQRQACRIHLERGGVTGGYTLDDWLEAEHELEHQITPVGKKDQVH